jgi:glutamate dehydrogenase
MSIPTQDTKKYILLKPSLNGNSGASTPHKLANVPGYATPPFKGKDEQYIKVHQHVLQTGFIPTELVKGEVNWFYRSLGIDDTYFENESVDVIAEHIIALYGAKVLAFTKHDINKLIIDLDKVVAPDPANGIDGSAMYIHSSIPGVSATEGPGATCEKQSDQPHICPFFSLLI